MKFTYKKFLIVFAIAIMLGGVYIYSSVSLNARAATPSDSSLSSSLGSTSSNTVSMDEKIAQDTSFLASLVSLTSINIDASLFSNPAFQSLNDNTVKLDTITPGRPNPFATIDTNTLNNPSVPVLPITTNQPIQITDKSAILSGVVNSTSGVTSTYFEYGTTTSLGRTTVTVKQSLIGTFVVGLTGLAPKTNYFFRAVAKINGSIVNGEIVSFTTN